MLFPPQLNDETNQTNGVAWVSNAQFMTEISGQSRDISLIQADTASLMKDRNIHMFTEKERTQNWRFRLKLPLIHGLRKSELRAKVWSSGSNYIRAYTCDVPAALSVAALVNSWWHEWRDMREIVAHIRRSWITTERILFEWNTRERLVAIVVFHRVEPRYLRGYVDHAISR